MLSPAFLMRQRAILERRIGTDVSGPEYAPGEEIACRAEPVQAVDLSSGGRGGAGLAFLPANCAACAGDRICVDGASYLLTKVRPVILPDGSVSHIEGEIT